MKPIGFMAKCQRVDIRTQYEQYGVRCFDLRVRFNKYGQGIVAHGAVEYCHTASRIYEDLAWLDARGGCFVRVLHEVRSARQYRRHAEGLFRAFCARIESSYPHLRFWCGRNLFSWGLDYEFVSPDPTCEERYASVCKPRLIDDWWPWLFARRKNRDIRARGTGKAILLIDYVDIK